MQVAVGEELGSLDRLHTLSIHLDSPDHPEPSREILRLGGLVPIMTWAQREASNKLLRAHAEVLAPLLGRSARLLRLVRRETEGASWRAYRICRADDTGDVVDVQFDAARSTGMSFLSWVREPPQSNVIHSISALIGS